MASVEELEQTLRRIDGRQYGAYKDLPRWVAGPSLALRIDHVQGDPFAAPSRVALRIPRARAGFEDGDLDDPDRSLALRDLLARRLATACARASAHRGSGKSGLLSSDRPGQQILATTAVLIDGGVVHTESAAILYMFAWMVDRPVFLSRYETFLDTCHRRR